VFEGGVHEGGVYEGGVHEGGLYEAPQLLTNTNAQWLLLSAF
jgi:hypothetical protein